MVFLTNEDLYVNIKSERLDQIIDEDTGVLNVAEATAIAVVKDSLAARYDTTAIFSTTGAARPPQVIRWVRCIMLYELSGRLPEKMVSERIVKNYDDTIGDLTQIEEGRKSTTLPILTENTEGGQTKKTAFRWGSNKTRLHQV